MTKKFKTYPEERLDPVMHAVNSMNRIKLKKWVTCVEDDADPRRLPGYVWHNFLFTERTAPGDAGYPIMDADTKYIFLSFARAKINSFRRK